MVFKIIVYLWLKALVWVGGGDFKNYNFSSAKGFAPAKGVGWAPLLQGCTSANPPKGLIMNNGLFIRTAPSNFCGSEISITQ
jgi:hypothetical protein